MYRTNTLLIALMLIAESVSVSAEIDLPASMRFSEDGTMLLQEGPPPIGLYDPTVLRTFELTFAQDDWWDQLTANYSTEEEIPADLTVDGVTYPDVGVRFKGMTSYSRIGDTQKKSFNISLDFQDDDQRLEGYKTLNLNNAASDPSFMREVLYFDMVRRYTPCPKANFVELIINGENWGLYVHVQQLNSDLIEEWFVSNDGTRWKAGVDANMGGARGGNPTDPNAPQPGTGGPFQLPPLDAWIASDQAVDLNGDGEITRADYQVLRDRINPFHPPTFDQWTASPQARDLNGDGEITEADYQIFLDRQATATLASPPAGKLQQQRPGDGRTPGGAGGGTGGGFASGDKALIWLGSDPAEYESQYELKTDNMDAPWTPLINTCDVLNNTSLEEMADDIESVLAVDRWLWFLAVENIFTDEDSYLTKGWDYQLYYEVETDRIHPLQHDGNESFFTRDANLSPFEGEDNANRPVISRLLAVPALRQRYIAHVRTILNESFNWNTLGRKVAAYRALIEAEVEADPKKLFSYEEFLSELTALEDFVEARRASLLTHPEIDHQTPEILSVNRATPDVLPASKATQFAPIGRPVHITTQVGDAVPTDLALLYYATGITGAFTPAPMFDDGAHADGAIGDGLFAGDIPSFPAGSLVRYYVEVRAADGTASFAPAGAEHDVFAYQVAVDLAASTSVVINELMADNDSYVEDPQGDFDDWIELYNISDREVDLSGMYLTDAEDDLRKWAFPEGTTLVPGTHLVVWADEDEDKDGLHADFKLSSRGEGVYLIDTDGRGNAILDAVLFEEQETDLSYGRLPDGTGSFQSIASPTPSAANLLITAVAEEQTEALPSAFSLEQNFPNPFNSGTLIRFSIPEGVARVELEIFNLAGQRVISLARGEYLSGVYEIHWDGRDRNGRELASGAYLYRLRTGTQVETHRMLLLR